jgi:predicted dehydrogenase
MKAAVIGRGFGAYAMKPAFEARGWEVELIPSRDPEAIKAACAGPFDLIAVHSPPFQHREHVLAAIAAGKDVLCDKPFGKNAAEAREMRDAAKAAGVLNFVNFEFRQSAGLRKAQEMIAAGDIGTLEHVAYQSHVSFARERKYGWLNDASLGGGWMGALSSHIIDAIRWITTSDVTNCGGISRLEIPERLGEDGAAIACTAEDGFAVWLSLGNGVSATLDAGSAGSVTFPQRMLLLGSQGAIEVLGEDMLTLSKPGAEPLTIDCTQAVPGSAWPALYNWIGSLEQALATRTQIAPSFDDGLATREVLDRLKATVTRV